MRELNKVHLMDCIEFLEGIPDNTIDSCVTDPPYGLEFMGKKWDKLGTGRLISDRDDWNWQAYRGNTGTDPLANKPRFGPVMTDSIARNEMQQFHYEWSQLVFRALKPGAHILAFSGTRTYHRLACAIEDAKFEIRDMVEWFYGSGFPKGRNISKALDKRAGLEREKLDTTQIPERLRRTTWTDFRGGRFHRADGEHGHMRHQYTLPVSPEAKQWNGWNTVLKPAHEPILLGRKPISEKSVEENMLRWGTGAINEGACRIAVNPDVDDIGERYTKRNVKATVFRNYPPEKIAITGVHPSGRYPANLIFSHHPDCRLIQEGKTITVKSIRKRDTPRMGRYGIYGKEQSGWSSEYDYDLGNPEVWACVPDCPVRMLNEQSGQTAKGHWPRGHLYGFGEHIGNGGFDYTGVGRYAKDSGGAARFFFTYPVVDEEDTIIYESSDIHKIWNASSSIIGDILGSLMADGMLNGERKGVVKSILNWKIDGSGKNVTVLSLKDMRFIILISTRQTTESRTYNLCLQKSIDYSIKENVKTIKSLMVSSIEDVKDVLNTSPSLISTKGLRELIMVIVRNVVKNINENGRKGIESISTSICANIIDAIQRSEEITTKRTKIESTLKEGEGIENDIQSKFFYCAKPSIAERNAGLDGERNLHITVKPLAIMRWLVRLVTRPGGIVLDPFLGSGTTAIAAELEGFNWLGCDNNKEYCEIARKRIKALGKNQTTRGE